MKSKISRILGVGLTIAVLASMLVVGTPVSAGNVAWSADSPVLNKPATVSNVDIVDFAAASNGTTAYAASSVNNTIQKTTNGGTTWLPTGFAGGVANKIAIAPDVADGSLVFVIADNTEVWVTENGGTSWGQMAAVMDLTIGAANQATMLRSIAVAPSVAGSRTIAVAGEKGASAGVWYFSIGGGITGSGNVWIDATANANWAAQTPPAFSFTAGPRALAVEFSPNFLADRTLVVVTERPGVGTDVLVQLAMISNRKWNGDFFGATWGAANTPGGEVVQNVSTGVAQSADIALPASFAAFDESTRVIFVAVAATGATVPGGLYRTLNAQGVPTALVADIAMKSVALNAASDKLVAGAFSSNSVSRLASPLTSAASAVAGSVKSPSISTTGQVTVGFLGTNVGAATVGGAAADESAFALSADDGRSFNDVAFVDSGVLNTNYFVGDLAVNADGTKTYLINEGTNGVVSLWRKTTGWERVFKVTGVITAPAVVPGFIVRPALDNFDVVFLADMGGTGIYYSNDAGQASWNQRATFTPINDLAAESASVLYNLTGTSVSKTTDGGFLWDNPLRTTGAGAGAHINLIAKDNLVVAGATGTAYSTDGGTTWTSTGQAFAGATLASADKLTAGGIITAVAGTAVKTFTIGTSTAFGTLNAATLSTGYMANGIALNGGVTYVVSNNGTDTEMWRSKITSLAWSKVTSTANLGMAPKALAVGTGGLLRAANSEDGSIWSYTEVMAAAGPTLTLPAANAIVDVNPGTGNANNVVVQWTAIPNSPPTGVTYNLQLALDSNFTQIVLGGAGQPGNALSGTLAIVGPTGAIPFAFQADTTYYARVRVDGLTSGAFDSPWAATRTFKIGSLRPLNLQGPANGAASVSVNPTFVWSPVTGATTYELVVSDDPTFAIITFSRTTSQPVFASDEQLAYDTVYYWRVRASAPATAVTPFATGIFTTEVRPPTPTTPPPPVTLTQTSVTVTVPAPPEVEVIPSYLLWIIIGIGAILVIALIVLIVRTRRTG